MSFARWAFLRPWLSPIHGRLELEQREERTRVPATAFQAIRVSLPTARQQRALSPDDFVAIRDALVLLAVLSRVDLEAYRHVLGAYCGLSLAQSQRCVDDPGFRTARFLLELIKDKKIFLDVLDAPLSPSFTAAVDSIASHCDRSLGVLDIPIVVVVTMGSPPYTFGAEPVYRALRELLARHGGRHLPVNLRPSDSSGRQLDCAFLIEAPEVQTVGALWPEEVELAGEMAETATELPLASLALQLGVPRGPHDVVAIGRMATRVLGAAEFSTKTSRMIGDVSLSWASSTPTPRVRMCTALAETKTTDSIALSLYDYYNLNVTRTWASVAYASFSEHASKYSSVRRLRLSKAELLPVDVDAIAAVLSAADPASHLFVMKREGAEGVDRSQAPASRWMLPKGATLRHQGLDDDDEHSVGLATCELPTDVAGVQVIQQESKVVEEEGVTVLVPGYGLFTAERDALIAVEDKQAAEGGGIIDIDLDEMIVPGDGEAVYRLLKLIGAPLTRLRLALRVNERFKLHTGRVLRSCPRLKSLVVAGCTVGAAAFLGACRDGSAHIEELNVAFDELDGVITELSDKATNLARTLKRVVFSFSSTRPRAGELQLQAVPSMLEANNTLEDVQVMVPRHLWGSYASSVVRYHGELLPVTGELFPLQCRLAFLSVFAAHQRQRKPEVKRAKCATTSVSSVLASFAVNQDIISIIFAFAAERLRRRVYCDVDGDERDESSDDSRGSDGYDGEWGGYEFGECADDYAADSDDGGVFGYGPFTPPQCCDC